MEIKIETIKEDIKQPLRLRDLFDYIETVSTAPTESPTDFYNQFKIYSSGGTKRLYIYDFTNNAWLYVALT